MIECLVVGAGGFVGAVLRYLVGLLDMNPGFPRIHTSLTLTIRPETLGNIEFNCIFTCHLPP